MRVAIDGRSLAAGAGRGVARVTFELLAAMAAHFPQDEWVVLLPAGAANLPHGTLARQVRVPSQVMFGSAALTGRPRIDRLVGGVDVVWLPAPAPVGISHGMPSVLTLHDISWEERPRDFTIYERAWHRVARPRSQAQRAARVAAVSEETRRVALERWGLDSQRVTVVLPPVAACSGQQRPSANPDDDPYFLWVGALEPRKAPDVLVAAWSIAHKRRLAARLVVVGEGRVPLTGPGVERRGRVTDAELGALYDRALALVMPSRLEGGGLPPLEAALHWTPSICSDLRVLRESLGADGAEWVPPDDAEALAEALLRTARDRGRRDRIAAAARRAAVPRTDPGLSATRMRALLAEAAGA